MTRSPLLAVAFAAVAFTAGAHAETMQFKGTMSPGAEVPPKTGSGTGDAMATLDTATKMLTYTVTYSGLSGPATAAHIHGPAAPGTNAGVLVPFASPASPIKGTVTLTDAQIADLKDGKMYANVHTAANPGGEIRGQMTMAK